MIAISIVVMVFLGCATASNKYFDGDKWVIQRAVHPMVQCYESHCTEDKTQKLGTPAYQCQFNYKSLDKDNKLVDGHDIIYLKVDTKQENVGIVTDDTYKNEIGQTATVELKDKDGEYKLRKVKIDSQKTGKKFYFCITDKVKVPDDAKKALEEACNEEGMEYVKNDNCDNMGQ